MPIRMAAASKCSPSELAFGSEAVKCPWRRSGRRFQPSSDAGGGGRGTWGDGNMQKYLERASKSTAATDDTIKAVCSLKEKKKKNHLKEQ